MGLLSLNLPVIGQSSATEDQKVRDALASLQTGVNGNLDEANVPNLAAAFTTYKPPIAWGGGVIVVGAGGTYLLTGGAHPAAAASGSVQTLGAAGTAGWAFRLDPARYGANARTTKLILHWELNVNAVAPGTNFVPGLYPVASFGGASGAAPTINTLGAVVTGSTATFTTPAASAYTPLDSTEINFPAAGPYCFGVSVGGGVAAGSQSIIKVALEMRQV
jgi:hypothetical protein